MSEVLENVNGGEEKREEKETVNKRITLSKNTYKKINIIKMLEDETVQNMQESDLVGYIIDKAVDAYYKSNEVQEKLKEL